MSIGKEENFLKIFFRTKAYNLKEQFFVIFKYYKNLKFFIVDLLFLFFYLFFNPFKISKNFLKKKKNKKIHLYGETPLSTLEKIVKECNISKKDKVIDLGAGRGRLCFWISNFLGCSVIGVERIPLFVKIANLIVKVLRIKNISFVCRDMFEISYKGFNFLYLYGTCLEDEKIFKFLKIVPKGVKVITISYPLNDYDKSYSIDKSFKVSFPWGETTCFLNIKK
jgi:hypothetical protein